MNRRTLLKFLTLNLFHKPQPQSQIKKQSLTLPKFQIGDCVEFIWEEKGEREYERGYVCGIVLPSYSQMPASTEWEYHFFIEDSSYKPCIGLIAEYPESWLRLIQNPKYFGFSQCLKMLSYP